jgi:hypothetical protein
VLVKVARRGRWPAPPTLRWYWTWIAPPDSWCAWHDAVEFNAELRLGVVYACRSCSSSTPVSESVSLDDLVALANEEVRLVRHLTALCPFINEACTQARADERLTPIVTYSDGTGLAFHNRARVVCA